MVRQARPLEHEQRLRSEEDRFLAQTDRQFSAQTERFPRRTYNQPGVVPNLPLIAARDVELADQLRGARNTVSPPLCLLRDP